MGSSTHSERPVLRVVRGLQKSFRQVLWRSKSSHQTKPSPSSKKENQSEGPGKLTLRFLYRKQSVSLFLESYRWGSLNSVCILPASAPTQALLIHPDAEFLDVVLGN